MKVRNHTFDLLCGLCIVRMICLHTISMCGHRGDYSFSKLMAWTFFFLGFFFFKAGYFNKGVQGIGFGSYLVDRVKRLLVPYLTWGLIGNLIYFGFLFAFPVELAPVMNRFRMHHLWEMSHFYGNPPVWFLFSFFMVYIFYYFIDKWEPKRGIGAVLILLLPLISYLLYRNGNPLWMSLNNVPLGLFFFYLGKYWHRVQNRMQWRHFMLMSLLLVIVFVHTNHFIHGGFDMSMNIWYNNPWGAFVNSTMILCGLSGVLLSLPQKRIPFINYIGEHSMVYFVGHFPLIFIYRFTCNVLHHRIWGSWLDFVIMTIAIFVICTLLVPLVEKIPWLSGRYRQKVVSL